ncbi:MAG: hypothetical protein RBJ76_05110 [Stenomitos frigidus ULC029]
MLKKLGFVLFVLVAGVGLGKVIKEPIAKLTGMSFYPSARSSQEQQSTPSLPPVAVPLSGVLENYGTASSTAKGSGRLRIYSAPIKEADGSGFQKECPESENKALTRKQHYFVRVSDWNSNQMVLIAFIRPGEKVDLKLPFGSYKIRYATGFKWYGEQHLFGEATRYTQLMEENPSQQPLKVKLSQKQTWDIALFPCGIDGNMTQQPIDPDDF